MWGAGFGMRSVVRFCFCGLVFGVWVLGFAFQGWSLGAWGVGYEAWGSEFGVRLEKC